MSFAPTRAFQSESLRHAALYVLLFACSMILLIALVYVTMDRSFNASLLRASGDDLLSIRKAYVAGLPRGKGVHEAEEMIEDRMMAPDPADRFLLQYGTQKLAGNMSPMTARAGTFSLQGGRGGRHVILGAGAFLAPGLYAFVGRDTHEVWKTERFILRDFTWIFAGSLLLASLSALLLSRSFMRRIDAISGTCRSIMAGRLGERIPAGRGKTELERLAGTINDMLDRIQALMESLRQVTNDIAHDMRTPLTHMRYALERARGSELSREGYARAIDTAIMESDQILEMFSALLRIAEIEAGARRDGFRSVDLSGLLRRAYEIYKPVMDDTGHSFAVDAADAVPVRGDPQLLLQMITNLLDNATAHTPAGTLVRAAVRVEKGLPVVVVSDSGPGIPEDARKKVLQRFYRLEQSRTSAGSGLGLSLVSVIAELHGAELVLSDNAPGLRISIRFPASHQNGGFDLPANMQAFTTLKSPNLISPSVHRSDAEPI